MPPGGEEGNEHGCSVREYPPATVRCDEDALPHSTPPLPAIAPLASQEKKQKHQEEEQHPAASLPEGPLVEILARVTYRSLCRFKCVSKPWLALCSSPDIRKRSPQTLSGFFYYDRSETLCFRNLSGRGPPLVDPSFPFLRESYSHISVKQVCGGLLLCLCWSSCNNKWDDVVCNPATEEWTVLPPILYPGQDIDHRLNGYIGYIGFDVSVPSRLLVFASLTIHGIDSGKIAVYSSETGQWSYLQSKWDSGTPVDLTRMGVFLNDTMHFATLCSNSLVTVDTEGNVWREIKIPDLPNKTDFFSIGQSQGHLYAWQIYDSHDCRLYIWFLEDHGTGKWTLKHTVNILELFGGHCHKHYSSYNMFAVHPDCNVIFLSNRAKTISCDLDNHKVDVIWNESMYGLPYIPCFSELPSAAQ